MQSNVTIVYFTVDGEHAACTNQVSADKSPIAQVLHLIYSVIYLASSYTTGK